MVKGHYLSVFSEENEKEAEDGPWNFDIKEAQPFRVDRSKLSSRTVSKSLKALTQTVERMQKHMDSIEKKQPDSKPTPAKKAAGKKSAKETAVGTIFKIINRSRKGVTTDQIKEKTGFDQKKIWSNINRLKSQGKVKGAGRGIYVKV